MDDDRMGRPRSPRNPGSPGHQCRAEDVMNPNVPPEPQVSRVAWNPCESERLYRRRLREVLGINAAGVEVMLHLRNQVIALQTRVRQLEAELAEREAGQNRRLTWHREAYFEASWQEMLDPEEQP
jgi:hypothetical protein